MLLPFDLQAWIDAHRHELRPPVANRLLWTDSAMDVMVVGGGTSRVDFHDDPHPEFFHQLEGSMVLRLMEEPGSPPRDVEIRAGEVFMLPAHVTRRDAPIPTASGSLSSSPVRTGWSTASSGSARGATTCCTGWRWLWLRLSTTSRRCLPRSPTT